MGYPGVEVTWQPGRDNNWVSYYEVYRDDVLLGKVAKGTFFFDHSAGADLSARYGVRTVDGAANVSATVEAHGTAAPRAQVLNDASDAIRFSGDWQREDGQWLAHGGTLISSQAKGATADVTFEGKRVLVFVKLGPDGGQAAVSLDGGVPELVDTFSADDIWGACVFEKELATGGRHTLSLTVVGEHNPRATGAFVRLDGLRAEAE